MTEPSEAQDTDIRKRIDDLKRKRVIGFAGFGMAGLLGIMLTVACGASNGTLASFRLC